MQSLTIIPLFINSFVSSAAVLKLGIWGLAVEQFLILAATVFYAWYIKTDMKALFHIKKPKVVGVPGAVISWVGALLIAVVVSDILIKLSHIFHVSTDYLLGVSTKETIDITGLKEEDVLLIRDLAERLRKE